MWKDFKEFAFQGNVFDLAVAVVIGAAFGKIVSSMVDYVITPIIGMISGDVDFSSLQYPPTGEAAIMYGMLIQSIIDFLIVAFFIFLVIRLLSKFKLKQEAEEEEVEEIDPQEALLIEIRDLLKEQQQNK